jgi:DNA-binding NarL/FixJ family response regulator
MSNLARPIRVLAADDHPLVRGGISALVAVTPDMELVAEASSGREVIELFRQHLPDVTLMDLQMSDISGIEAIEIIRSEHPAARIIVLTTFSGDVLAQRALKAGAQAYLLKGEVRKELVETIRAVHLGQTRINSEVAMQLAIHAAHEALSNRELSVLQLAASGKSNKTIARALEITEGTVKTHMKSVLAKLRVNDRTHAVSVAIQRGIIAPWVVGPT